MTRFPAFTGRPPAVRSTWIALLLSFVAAAPAACPATLRQPVHEYFLSFLSPGEHPEGEIPGFNPFRHYTHLGTDFGVVRTPDAGESEIFGTAGCVVAQVGAEGSAGLWHSLDGLIREPGRSLDFLRPWPAEILPAYQPRITGVGLRVEGYGTVRVEIKDSAGAILWSAEARSESHEPQTFSWPCDPEVIRGAREIIWLAGPRSSVCVGSLTLELSMPERLSLEDYILLASYAKFARCRDAASAFVRDRAHTPAGTFDGVPATAMFPLAACTVMEAGFMRREDAVRIFRQTLDAVFSLRRSRGLLPHFVSLQDGRRDLVPGTEFSTLDTAIAWQSLLLAATWLEDSGAADRILAAIREIDFQACRGEDGRICHGFLGPDAEEPLAAWWTDWGGETALVLMLERMALGDAACAPMEGGGRVFRDCGFIAEIAGLFYPWFSCSRPDAVTGVDWLGARRRLLADQQAYFPSFLPESFAATNGIFGLSAGETKDGSGYQANGAALPDIRLIHPHYMLMSATIDPDRSRARTGLRRLVEHGLLPPWGMVENVTADHDSWLPMIGSLNAAFETLSAGHFRAAGLPGNPNGLYAAARRCRPAVEAVRRFWPDAE